MAAAAMMREQIDVPALRAQKIEIATGRFRAGDDHQIGIAGNRFARTHHHEIDARFELERIEIVEIGDPRQCERRRSCIGRRLARIAAGRVHPRPAARPRVAKKGSTPKPRHACSARDEPIAVVEQRGIAAELVDDKTLRSSRHRRDRSPSCVPTSCAMTPPRSMSPTSTTGTSAARAKPILAMSAWRRFTSAGLPAPSTSTRSARAFSRSKLSSTARHQRSASSPHIRGRATVAMRRPCTITCAPIIGLWLQQHRVHVGVRLDSGSQRLECLRAADLAAVDGDGGVVRHVLRLEGEHAQAAPREGARTGRRRCSDLPTFEPAPWIINARAITEDFRTRRRLAP